MSNKQQIAIDEYDLSKIYQIEMLYHKYYQYLDQDVNDILRAVAQRLHDEFINELHEWHLTQPEGLLELVNNTSYNDSVWNHHSLSEPDRCTLEGLYRKIFVSTHAYKLLYPQGNSDYTLFQTTYGVTPQQKSNTPKLDAMLKGLKKGT